MALDERFQDLDKNEAYARIDEIVNAVPDIGDIRSKIRNQLRRNVDEHLAVQPSGTEKELLGEIGEAGLEEIQRLREGQLFELDPETAAQLDRIRTTRTESAERSLEFGLERAAGTASAGAAGRGLPRGSLRAELQARLQGPVLERFQQQIAGIEAEDAQARINIPRGDVGIRQSVLASPALTALQRNRLQQAELRFRINAMQQAREDRKRARRGGIGGALGTIAGGAIGFFAGGPAGAAAGAQIGGSLGQGDVGGAVQGGLSAYGAGTFGGGDTGVILDDDPYGSFG